MLEYTIVALIQLVVNGVGDDFKEHYISVLRIIVIFEVVSSVGVC